MYEGPAVRRLAELWEFDRAGAVFELGCGTGSLAAGLLGSRLPPSARYVAADVSTTMVRLARRRLAPWSDRVSVRLLDPPATTLPADDGAFDRFVAAYVFDLLSPGDAGALAAEAARLLAPGGLLAVVSLTAGTTAPSRDRLLGLGGHRAPLAVNGGRMPPGRADRPDHRAGLELAAPRGPGPLRGPVRGPRRSPAGARRRAGRALTPPGPRGRDRGTPHAGNQPPSGNSALPPCPAAHHGRPRQRNGTLCLSLRDTAAGQAIATQCSRPPIRRAYSVMTISAPAAPSPRESSPRDWCHEVHDKATGRHHRHRNDRDRPPGRSAPAVQCRTADPSWVRLTCCRSCPGSARTPPSLPSRPGRAVSPRADGPPRSSSR